MAEEYISSPTGLAVLLQRIRPVGGHAVVALWPCWQR